jgi:tRNA modification GTPase
MTAFATLNDTICALATPSGVGAIGLIRLSGPQAIAIADAVFPSRDLQAASSRTAHVGWIMDGALPLDEVVVTVFRGPRSYTGEDVVELSCHGSPYILDRAMHVLLNGGARLAEPGEFTMRAFLNGRMDLAQAEAVADMIASESAAAHRLATQQMRGGFSRDIKAMREQLIGFAGLVELELDFVEEDVAFADKEALQILLEQLKVEVSRLAASFRLGNVMKNGVMTVIAGRPNAGKSTLLNALLNEERALVSDIAGTTRDTIEEELNIEGIRFRLIDTAGIREATDAIEHMGVQRTMEKIRQVQHTDLKTLVVGNKSDLLDGRPAGYPDDTIWISARDKSDLHVLKDALYDVAVASGVSMDQTIVSNVRHVTALQQTLQSLDDVLEGLSQDLSGELLALDLRRALNHLGEITGQVTHEDLLDFIFSKFCIGK